MMPFLFASVGIETATIKGWLFRNFDNQGKTPSRQEPGTRIE